jgi:periplasmic protein TonB
MNDPGSFMLELPSPETPGPRLRGRTRSNRALTITVLVSLGLHLAAVIMVLLLLHAGVPVVDGPEKPIEVELVMEEHKGDPHPTAAPQTPDAMPADKQPQQEKPAEAKAPAPPAEASAEAPPVTQENAAEPEKEPVPAPSSAESPTPAEAAPPPVPPAVTITLRGTDSPSDAKSWGKDVIPAAPDAVFHNRPPAYPAGSVQNGEQGTVVLLIHVSPSGQPGAVDVLRSSGYLLLDNAARDAVTRWRFLPAVKDGQPVASDMTMGFVFAFE